MPLMVLLCSFCSTTAQAGDAICFYSPESNINNLKLMEKSFHAYFSSQGDASFHAFASEQELEQFRSSQGCSLLMIANSYFLKNQARLSLHKKLDGMLNGKTSQKQVLSAGENNPNISDLEEQTVSSSGSVANTRKALLSILGAEHENIVRSIQILEVPKDIDALMAINYGVAAAALTSDSSVELFGSLNPKQAKKLKHMGGEVETPFPVVAVEKENKTTQAMLDRVAHMHESPAGKSKLLLLGLERFSDSSTKKGQ